MKKNYTTKKRIIDYTKDCSGFTLVELIVVLAMLAIMLGVAVTAGLGWQDWARFKHEENVAENLFFVAQNQLTELDASGALDNKVNSLLKENDQYKEVLVLATKNNDSKLTKIKYGDSDNSTDYYSWSKVWATATNNSNDQDATIISLRADKGDYSKYMAMKNDASYSGDKPSGYGAECLFDLLAPYVSDTSVLNGSIVLELSPEAGQVFSVCYSDVAAKLDYIDANNGTTVQINDRRLYTRRENKVGYYSSEKLYEKLIGQMAKESELRFQIRNAEILEMVVGLRTSGKGSLTEGDILDFELFSGDSGANDALAMSFSVVYKDENYNKYNHISSLAEASAHPTLVEVTFGENAGVYSGTKQKFRVPIWVDDTDNKMHIVLDAADIQAQSYSFYKSLVDSNSTDEEKEAFKNTFSFYRFGLSTGDAKDVHYLYGKLYHTDNDGITDKGSYSERFIGGGADGDHLDGYVKHTESNNDNGTVGECTTFESFDKLGGSSANRKIKIGNERHFYNIRYETDYKKNGSISNTFCLTDNLDWNEFVGKGQSDINYFLNSIDTTQDNFERVESGINYTFLNDGDTSSCCFPGFRCLSKNDKLTGIKDSEEGTEAKDYYSISNLNISITSNIIYGVYDGVLFDEALDADKKKEYKKIKDSCLDGNFKSVIMYWDKDSETFSYKQNGSGTTDTFCGVSYSGDLSINSDGSSLARSGQLPLGLFAENLGSIEDLVLDKHIVKGMEVLDENTTVKHSSTESNAIIYTCMVGGFVGNNIGEIKNLTLLDSAEEGSLDNKTLINGRTDVGGIVGRQSFATVAHKDVVLSNLRNEGSVTGYENVGGIVGRAYVHYVNDKDNVDINGHSTQYSVYDNDANQGSGYNIASNEQDRPRYKYYHDGYVITDSGYSISGEKVYRAKTVTIKDCVNKGKVRGDSLIYDSTNKLDNVSVYGESNASKNIHCAFIGGIAGITQDGYIYDSYSSSNRESLGNGKCPIYHYYAKGYYDNGFSYVTVDNCTNEVLYSRSEIDAFMSNHSNLTAANRDCYVGGLVGYARLTSIKNCNNTELTEEAFTSNRNKYPLVIGRRYVGGLVGCSDETVYNNSGSGYGATNYNLVIGERYVGGVIGSLGIGDKHQETLDFRNPAANEASFPSQIYFDNNSSSEKPETAKNILNKGIALGWNSVVPFENDFSSENDLFVNDKYEGSGAIGGVVGASRSTLLNADNLQSNSTKQFALNLIGFTNGANNQPNYINSFVSGSMDADSANSVVSNSLYGGNCVGGIVGYVYGNVNKKNSSVSNTSCEVDAVVYGQDFVGGGFGTNETSGSDVYNFYPISSNYQNELDGMIVIGRDAVGGIYGQCRDKYNQSDNNRISADCNSPYSVYGRYAVGGMCGLFGYQDKYFNPADVRLSGSEGRVKVDAIAYAGGFAGVCEGKNVNYTGKVTDMSVRAKYFAGGYFGALLNNETLQYVNKNVFTVDNIDVSADIFAGSVCGIYYSGSNGYKEFTSVTTNNSQKKKDGTLVSCIDAKCVESAEYVSAGDAFNSIVNTDIKDHSIFASDSSNSTVVDMSVNELNYESHGKVEAALFAGGFIGYIPDNSNITISNFTNGSNVNASGYVGGDSVSVYESDNSEDKYAYLGAVVGRVPRGVTIKNCVNKVSGSLNESNTETYYSAANATYLGGLTEVNAGVITDCVNETEYTYGAGGVGAFAGKNGTAVTNVSYTVIENEKSRQDYVISAENSNGLITKCVNKGKIVSEEGFAGGMAAANGYSSGSVMCAAITDCINLADIGVDSGESSAGMVPHSSGKDIITICRNYGRIAGTNKYGIAAGSVGYIAKNLEASGLSEYDSEDPVAPLTSNLARNFYIFDKQDMPDESGSLTDNTTIVSPIISNTGNCYVSMSSSSGKPSQTLINSFYDRNLGGRNSTVRSFIQSNQSEYAFDAGADALQNSDFNIVYEFMTNEGTSRSVFMKYFDVCFYAPYAADFEKILSETGDVTGYNFKYYYTITFVYEELDNQNNLVEKTKTLTRNVSFGPEMNLFNVDRVEAPFGVGIKKVILNASAEENIKLHDDTSCNFWYYGAYWEDSNGMHYMNPSTNIEDFENPSQDSEFFISTVRTNNDGSSSEAYRYEAGEQLDPVEEQSSVIPIYDKKPNEKYTYSYINYVESSNDILEKESCYSEFNAYSEWGMDLDVDVIHPQNGLDADSVRLYLFNRYKLYCETNGWSADTANYLYDVNFFYRDKYGNEKYVTVSRLIQLQSDGPQYVYDTIEIPKDQNENVIRPTKIQVHMPSVKTVEGIEGTSRYAIAGITWMKSGDEFTFNRKGNVPTLITDADRVVQSADETNGLEQITFESVASTPLEPTYNDVTKDRWSKQLYSQYYTLDGEYRLVFKKHNIVQNNIVISGLGTKNPISFPEKVEDRENTYVLGNGSLDSKFVAFVNDYQQYPDELFVDAE